MQDLCVILDYDGSATDDYNLPAPSYVPRGEAVPCGLNPRQGDEALRERYVTTGGASLRLPLGTPIDASDRVRITHRYGEALDDPLLYEVVGSAERGASGLVVQLEQVTTGES